MTKDPEKLTKDFTLELVSKDLFNYAKEGLVDETVDVAQIRNKRENEGLIETQYRVKAWLLIDVKYMPDG